MSTLKKDWSKITSKYSSDTNLSEGIFNNLIDQYSSKSRHYHNVHHIESMLTSISEFTERLSDPDAVYFAVMFHDVVYESLKGDNEEKSADYAREALTKLNFPPARIDKVFQLILATKNHTKVNPNEDFDTQILLDADLKVLGTTSENYLEYSRQIRKEYQLVPDLLYKPGRKKVLVKFLEISFLYRTTEFRERYEEKARENLRSEMEKL